MRQRSSDDEEDKPTEIRNKSKDARISNDKKKSLNGKPSTSPAHVPSSEKSSVPRSKVAAVSTPITPSQQPQAMQSMKMDAALDINDEDDNVTAILPDDEIDLTIMDMDANDLQELEDQIFPTITSVTSLHPSNDLFESNPLENGAIL